MTYFILVNKSMFRQAENEVSVHDSLVASSLTLNHSM